MVQDVAKIEAEMQFMTRSGTNSQDKLNKIIKIQQIWKIKNRIKKFKEQKRGSQPLHTTVREFFEDRDDPIPSNYTISVYSYIKDRLPLGFRIVMVCNNFLQKRRDHII